MLEHEGLRLRGPAGKGHDDPLQALQAGDVIKLGMHEVTYSPLDVSVEPSDDTRATRTTVLHDSDTDLDSGDDESETDDDESEADDEEQDESSYSSIARGS